MKHTTRLAAAAVLSSVLPYTSYEVDEAEYIGSYDGDADDTEELLRDRGYHYQLFAATKRNERTERLDEKDEPRSSTSQSSTTTDDGSYARIPEQHPEEAAETALADVPAGECQYHVHLFERPQNDAGHVVTDLYGHYEIHPYPHTPTWDFSRPWPRHYRPTWDHPSNDKDEWTYLRGVRDPRLDTVLRVP